MERREALARLRRLIGKDLRPLADRYGITVWKNGRKNKGWAGQVLERTLDFGPDSSPLPDFGSWDLKLVSLHRDRGGALAVKESMAITMIDPADVLARPFADSQLLRKFRQLVVVARIFENVEETSSLVYAATEFDLRADYAQVAADYELVRATLRRGGLRALNGYQGVLVQARTKGPGHGSTSRAFYARPQFVARMLRLSPHRLPAPVVPARAGSDPAAPASSPSAPAGPGRTRRPPSEEDAP